jgi:ribosome maturation factor RimP
VPTGVVNDDLRAMIEPVISQLGYGLWGIEYLSQGKYSALKVYIEADAGITVDDCARVSRQLSGLLDVEEPISGNYTLEVSSPGVDRRLFSIGQCREFAGSRVKLSLRRPYEGRRRFEGLLSGVEKDEVILRVADQEYLFPFEEIDRVSVIADL